MKTKYHDTYLHNPRPHIPTLVNLRFTLKTNREVVGRYCYNPIPMFGEWGIRTVDWDWIPAFQILSWKPMNQREVTVLLPELLANLA